MATRATGALPTVAPARRSRSPPRTPRPTSTAARTAPARDHARPGRTSPAGRPGRGASRRPAMRDDGAGDGQHAGHGALAAVPGDLRRAGCGGRRGRGRGRRGRPRAARPVRRSAAARAPRVRASGRMPGAAAEPPRGARRDRRRPSGDAGTASSRSSSVRSRARPLPDGVHAVHRVGEVGLELAGRRRGGSCPQPRGADGDRRLSTLTHLPCPGASSGGAAGGQPLVLVGLAARVALTSMLLPSRRTVRVTWSPVLCSRTWPTRDSADSTRSPLTATMTSPTLQPGLRRRGCRRRPR